MSKRDYRETLEYVPLKCSSIGLVICYLVLVRIFKIIILIRYFPTVVPFLVGLIQNMKHSFTAFPVQLNLYSEYTVRKYFLFQISFIELNFLHKLKLKVNSGQAIFLQ